MVSDANSFSFTDDVNVEECVENAKQTQSYANERIQLKNQTDREYIRLMGKRSMFFVFSMKIELFYLYYFSHIFFPAIIANCFVQSDDCVLWFNGFLRNGTIVNEHRSLSVDLS